MIWKNKLAESDYTVYRSPDLVMIKDNRNKIGYRLTIGQRAELQTIVGDLVPDTAWIRVAIANAMVPHPYDEYISQKPNSKHETI